MVVIFDDTKLLPIEPSLVAEPNVETVTAWKAHFPDLCLRCLKTAFSPLAWAHLRGDTLRQSIPDDPTQNYHIEYGQDYVFRVPTISALPKRRGPVLDVKVIASALITSCQEGCRFCAFVARFAADDALENDAEHVWTISMQLKWPEKSSGILMPMALEVGLHHVVSGGGELGLISFIDTDSVTKFEALEPSPEPSFEAALGDLLRQARAWLRHCDRTHEQCARAGDHRLPARLLDLVDYSDKQHVRLVETGPDSDGEYAVLSYVWGVSKTITLTQSTYPKLIAGVHVLELPLTLIHALNCASFLDIRYLWVDALCILQDSQEDKAQEIPRMHDYYRSACVTISASGARDVHSGFLDQQITEHEVHAAIEKSSLTRIPAYFADRSATLLINGVLPLYHFTDEPVNKRAWCLQESVLPRRLITFSSTGGISMRCLEGEQCAGQMLSSPRDESPGFLSRGSIAKAHDIDKISGVWFELVQDYTRRSLTYQSDILVAIGALARDFHEEHGSVLGQYIAGIWEKDARTGLLWLTNGDFDTSTINRPPILQSNPGCAHAPSWSWASVASRVFFHTDPETYHPSPFSGEESWERMFRPHWYCELLDHHITFTSELDPFGAVKDGFLKVRAPLRQIQKHDETVDGQETSPYAGKLFFKKRPGGGDAEAEIIYMDSGSSLVWAEERTYYWLGIWYAGRGRARGLIIERVGEEAMLQFQRIGLGVFMVDTDDFPDADLHKETVVTLV